MCLQSSFCAQTHTHNPISMVSKNVELWIKHRAVRNNAPAVSKVYPRHNCQKFREGVGGRGWRPAGAKIQQNVPRSCVPLLITGDRKKDAEKRPESVAWEGFPRANPLHPPTF